jgi:hypothetical protein
MIIPPNFTLQQAKQSQCHPQAEMSSLGLSRNVRFGQILTFDDGGSIYPFIICPKGFYAITG